MFVDGKKKTRILDACMYNTKYITPMYIRPNPKKYQLQAIDPQRKIRCKLESSLFSRHSLSDHMYFYFIFL